MTTSDLHLALARIAIQLEADPDMLERHLKDVLKHRKRGRPSLVDRTRMSPKLAEAVRAAEEAEREAEKARPPQKRRASKKGKQQLQERRPPVPPER
jgi:hypothetical protein